jgi:hypothetical protein
VTGSHDVLGMMEITVVFSVMPYSLVGRCRYTRLDGVLQRAASVYVVAAQAFTKLPAFCAVLTFMNFSKQLPT